MPSVNLMALTPFNKNKDIWNYFFKENIMATLMANGCDSAIFSDEVPPLPHPALSNNILYILTTAPQRHLKKFEKFSNVWELNQKNAMYGDRKTTR